MNTAIIISANSFIEFHKESIKKYQSKRLAFRPLEKKDKILFKMINTNPNIRKWHGSGLLINLENIDRVFESNLNKKPDFLGDYVLYDKNNPKHPIGIVSLYLLDDPKIISYGYSILPRFQGKGYGNELSQATAEYVSYFIATCKEIVENNPNCEEQYKKYGSVYKINLMCNSDNIRSKKCIEKVNLNGKKFKLISKNVAMRNAVEADEYELIL